jgi:UDP-4-amino-4,6-dideoxy-N-acetyl-beta-L-altrosamine transaminase
VKPALPRTALAIDGGRPVREHMLPYGHQVIGDDDVEAVVRVLRSDWLTTGPLVERFEAELAERVGARYAVVVSSGTAALHAAAAAIRMGPGATAIVPALTFAASANCFRYLGASVRFADVRGETLTVDPAAVERLIDGSTRAILAVDYAGQPADLDELRRLARRGEVVLIEDAAHAIGATYRGRRVGSIADLTTFSFHPVKQMTTGEGGAVATDDADLAQRMRAFRNHGITSDVRDRAAQGTWWYDLVELGFNYRLTDLQCALGLSQLRKLDGWLARRAEIAARYDRELSVMAEIETPVVAPERTSAWHLYVVRFRLDRLRADRELLFRALRAEGIGVNVHYIPVPRLSYYRDATGGPWPVSDDTYERMVTLPLWAGMTDDDVGDVVEGVRKVVDAYRAGP